MDTDSLVTNLFDGGMRLIEALERADSRVLVAAWVKTSEEQRWTLYLASKELEAKGIISGYRTLSNALRLINNQSITMSNVKLIGAESRTARDLLEGQPSFPVREPQRVRFTSLGGIPVEDVFVYPTLRLKATSPTQTNLKFTLRTHDDPMKVMSRFHPNGEILLNRTEWRGKEPRTCGVGSIKGRSQVINSREPMIFDIEVIHKPKGCITYSGETRYDGWTTIVLDRARDGTLLDGNGEPLPEGHPPIYRQFEVYKDMDFNEIDFGDFIEEYDVEGIRQIPYETVINSIQASSKFGMSIVSKFMAPMKHRPTVKIVLAKEPTATAMDGFGTRFYIINESTPHLQQVILDKVTDLVKGFVEGRYSMKSVYNKDLVFVHLDDLVIDNRTAEIGDHARFHCLINFLSDSYLFDLAMKLMQLYEIDASVVDGHSFGLLLSRTQADRTA